MLIPFLRQLLILTAALLTVTGSLSVYYGTDGPLATLEAEDTEEDEQREEVVTRVSEPILEATLHVSVIAVDSSFIDTPIVCGPHNERGPPLV